jgi:hypothetical protein
MIGRIDDIGVRLRRGLERGVRARFNRRGLARAKPSHHSRQGNADRTQRCLRFKFGVRFHRDTSFFFSPFNPPSHHWEQNKYIIRVRGARMAETIIPALFAPFLARFRHRA